MNIDKVEIINLNKISNIKGNIIKIINKKDKRFKKFGEIYFSEIKKNYIKGWNLHKKYYCQLSLCYGKIILRLKDKNSNKKTINISLKNPKLIIIPPNIWFSFESVVKKSMIFNILSGIHNSKETEKIDIKK